MSLWDSAVNFYNRPDCVERARPRAPGAAAAGAAATDVRDGVERARPPGSAAAGVAAIRFIRYHVRFPEH